MRATSQLRGFVPLSKPAPATCLWSAASFFAIDPVVAIIIVDIGMQVRRPPAILLSPGTCLRTNSGGISCLLFKGKTFRLKQPQVDLMRMPSLRFRNTYNHPRVVPRQKEATRGGHIGQVHRNAKIAAVHKEEVMDGVLSRAGLAVDKDMADMAEATAVAAARRGEQVSTASGEILSKREKEKQSKIGGATARARGTREAGIGSGTSVSIPVRGTWICH